MNALAPVKAIDGWATNGHLIADVARLGMLRPEWRTLDVTYGYGTFWSVWRPDVLVGTDLNPAKSLTGEAVDYTDLPFAARSFDAAVFDPDYKLTGTAWDVGGMDERYGTDTPIRWQDRMANIRAGAREAARVADKVVLVKCQDQVVSSKIRWQTRAVADEVEPLGFGLRARFDFLGGREQPLGRRQVNPRACSSQLLVFERGWSWSDLAPEPAEELTLFPEPMATHALAVDVAHARRAPARADDPTTSKRAAMNVAPRTGSSRMKVLALHAEHTDRGLTDDQMYEQFGDPRSSRSRTSRQELVDLYDPPLLHHVDGEERLTRAGNAGRVWRLTETGRKVAEDLRT